MKLEFIHDSEEFKTFERDLQYHDELPFHGEGDSDYYETVFVFRHMPTGKLYSVAMAGSRNKMRFCAYRRNFKSGEPLVINFHEVKPKEITVTSYETIS